MRRHDDRPEPRHEDALRRALQEEAAMMEPSDDGLDRIRERTARPRWSWGGGWDWRPVAVVAAGVAVAAAGVGVVLRGAGEPVVVAPAGTPSPGATATGTPTPGPTAEPTEPAPTPDPTRTGGAPRELVTVPVYYAVDGGEGVRLAREFRQLPDQGSPAATAVMAVLGQAPLDPDYTSLWHTSTELLSIGEGDGEITVDLSAEAREADVGAEAAEIAVQQLVYTATAALQSSAPVRILVEGEPIEELWGHVRTDEPIRRADPLAVRLSVQVNDPAEGATSGSPVRVRGEAAAFEANVPWRILSGGEVVEEGFATAEECCRFAPFEFSVDLEPGTYEVQVLEDDPSGGAEGGAPDRDTKRFTVSG